MRRWQAIAGLAAGVALTAGACGVQPTGVHVANAAPFSVSRSTFQPSASSAGGSYEVTLFLTSKFSSNYRKVTRLVPKKPAKAADLLQYLSVLSAEDEENFLTTSVPGDITLEPTSNAHEYRVLSPTTLGSVALKQMACTFDAYWRDQKPGDGQEPSTQFLLFDSPPNGWDDCPQFYPPEPEPGQAASSSKPSRAASLPPTHTGR